jgi:aminoglycoside phosphotransferase (APT) family kinase protein
LTHDLVAELLPELEAPDVVTVEDGWDHLVLDIGGEWIVRIPRRPAVADWMDVEIRLLDELAPRVPAPIPRYERVARNGVRAVAYPRIDGRPLEAFDDGVAGEVAAFLVALHGVQVDGAAGLGLSVWDLDRREQELAAFRERVLPVLDAGEREAGAELLERARAEAAAGFRPAVVHADLGPEHLLCEGGRLRGVIDWSDARIGDPAIDLAWLLHGTPISFADAVAAAYGADAGIAARAQTFHRLAPWYEVLYGVDFGLPKYVESGLAGVRARLARG